MVRSDRLSKLKTMINEIESTASDLGRRKRGDATTAGTSHVSSFQVQMDKEERVQGYKPRKRVRLLLGPEDHEAENNGTDAMHQDDAGGQERDAHGEERRSDDEDDEAGASANAGGEESDSSEEGDGFGDEEGMQDGFFVGEGPAGSE